MGWLIVFGDIWGSIDISLKKIKNARMIEKVKLTFNSVISL